MRRLPDWPRRLADYLAEAQGKPFSWGSNDCILFMAKGIEAMTGQNFYYEYLPYRNKEEAMAIIEKNGGVMAMVSKALGPGHRNHLKAKRGDAVLVKMPAATCGLVADDGESVILITEQGTTRRPLKSAWRIWSF